MKSNPQFPVKNTLKKIENPIQPLNPILENEGGPLLSSYELLHW